MATPEQLSQIRESLKTELTNTKEELGSQILELRRALQMSMPHHGEEDNMDMLRDIVKRKSAQGIKLGDGKKVTVDMQTANAILSAIDKVKPATKPKMMTIVNKGNSRQFLQLAKLVFGK